MKKFSNLIHIGLGKTATSTMQQFVYPIVSTLKPQIKYNDATLMKYIRNYHYCGERENLKEAKKILDNGNILISNESLCNWNPRYWEYSADRNLELFGQSAHIVITIRKTEEYLTSIYQQIVHEGNVVMPESFFVSAEQANILQNFSSRNQLNYFDVDSFNLNLLKKIYEDRFSNVTLVPLHKLSELKFLIHHYELTEKEAHKLRKLFQNAPHINRSYSRLAMNITFAKESLINKLGLKTIGSRDKIPASIEALINSEENRLSRKTTTLKKLEQFPSWIVSRLNCRFKWRYIMQNIINKYFSYEKYTLPKNVYRNIELANQNDALLQSI